MLLTMLGPASSSEVDNPPGSHPSEVGPELDARSAPVSRDAWLTEVVEQNLDFIWRLLRRLGVTQSHADDATQQVFVVLADKLDHVERGKERSFLFGVALRIAARTRRAGGRQRAMEAEDGHDYDQVDPRPLQDELTDRRRAAELLDDILETLPEELRIVFALYELDALSVPEIAEMLDIPQGTAASRLRRAREKFKEQVKRVQARWEHERAQRRSR